MKNIEHDPGAEHAEETPREDGDFILAQEMANRIFGKQKDLSLPALMRLFIEIFSYYDFELDKIERGLLMLIRGNYSQEMKTDEWIGNNSSRLIFIARILKQIWYLQQEVEEPILIEEGEMEKNRASWAELRAQLKSMVGVSQRLNPDQPSEKIYLREIIERLDVHTADINRIIKIASENQERIVGLETMNALRLIALAYGELASTSHSQSGLEK